MSSISSMARFRNPLKSSAGPSFSGTKYLSRSGSMGNISKRESVNLAPSFNATGKSNKGTTSAELSTIETEYIKNLQQQIYFLELEANFLRDQARKATDLQPRMTEEAGRMLGTLKDYQVECDNLQLEIKRKESNLSMVHSEKVRLDGKLKLLEDNHTREKKLLVEEIVSLKKLNEKIQREIADKENHIVNVRHELDKGSSSLSSAEHQVVMLQTQLDQKTDHLKSTQLALEEKRTECIQTKSQLQEMEDKYYTSTASIQDMAVADLRNENRELQRKLKETEMASEHDRFMKSKMAEDVNKLVKENALFGSQALELEKQLERERGLRETRDTRHASNITELVSVRDKEKHLQFELNHTREEVKVERERVVMLMEKISKQDQLNNQLSLTLETTRAKLAELEGRHSGQEHNNSQLRRDKMLLVDHVSELQKQVSEKDKEVLTLHSHIRSLESRLTDAEKRCHLESTLQTQKWTEFERMAESMKKLSQNMTARSLTPEY